MSFKNQHFGPPHALRPIGATSLRETFRAPLCLDAGQNARRIGVANWVTSRGPENKMLIHLPIIILASLQPTAIVDAVPKFDIARECKDEGGTEEMLKKCADDETQARNQLQTEWIQFSASAKTRCNQETSMDGTPSYVEFLTCLEMERDVSAEREANKRSK